MALPAVAPFLMALVQPILTKILLTLGIGLVTYTGYDYLLDFVVAKFQAAFTSIPPQASQLIYMSGIPEGVGIILSAIAMRFALTSFTKFQVMTQ